MRIAGIVLLVLGILLIASSALQLAAPSSSKKHNGLSESQQRMDAFIPGAILAVIGIALAMFSAPRSIITATPADEWLSIKITPAAAEQAKRAIAERRYPSGTGLRVVAGPTAGTFEVKYDMATDGDDCVGEDQGVSVFVEKQFAPAISGRTIDFRVRQFVLEDRSDV